MESSERHNTLVHFRFNPEYRPSADGTAKARRKLAATVKDVLKVPVGTIVYDEDTGEKVYDFSRR